VPLRWRVVDALERLPHRRGIVFPAPEGARVNINNWRNREWTPALAAAGIQHRRIYDLRHTYATWSLAARVDIFTLARRMGTSVKMIDRTYGHLVAGADVYERELLDDSTRRSLGPLDALWTRWRFAMQPDRGPVLIPATGTRATSTPTRSEMCTKKAAGVQRLSPTGATGLEPATSGVTGRRSNRLSYAPVGRTVWQPISGEEEGPTADRQSARRRDRNWP
jgi:hypothetical protein